MHLIFTSSEENVRDVLNYYKVLCSVWVILGCHWPKSSQVSMIGFFSFFFLTDCCSLLFTLASTANGKTQRASAEPSQLTSSLLHTNAWMRGKVNRCADRWPLSGSACCLRPSEAPRDSWRSYVTQSYGFSHPFCHCMCSLTLPPIMLYIWVCYLKCSDFLSRPVLVYWEKFRLCFLLVHSLLK